MDPLLSKNTPTGLVCTLIPSAASGKYIFISRKLGAVEKDCPAGCSECAASNIYFENSAVCSACTDNTNTLSAGRCILATPTCPAGKFASKNADASGYFCNLCPNRCSACSLNDIDAP
jgi:hypothetical protein